MRAALRQLGIIDRPSVGNATVFHVEPSQSESVAEALGDALSTLDQDDTRALFCFPDVALTPNYLARVEPLSRVIIRARSGGLLVAIDDAGIERSQVVFEIVETERTHAPKHLRNILDYYRGAGFRIALDNVGSGYSSLNLIHLLRPDIVKLDMELVRDVDQDPYRARIAANLLDIANTLGIDALAEGIETEGELAWVQQHGAKYVQGFLIARPAPIPLTAIPLRSPVHVATSTNDRFPPTRAATYLSLRSPGSSLSPKNPPPPSPPLTRSMRNSFESDTPPTMMVTL